MTRLFVRTTNLFVLASFLNAGYCFAGPRDQVDAANALVWARQHKRPKITADDFSTSQSASAPKDAPLKELVPNAPTPDEVEREAEKTPHPAPLPAGAGRGGKSLMRLEFDAPSRGSARTARQQVYFFTGESVYGRGWCTNCPIVKQRLGSGNADVQIIYTDERAPGEQVYPAIRFMGPNGKWFYPAAEDGESYVIPKNAEELAGFVKRKWSQSLCLSPSESAGAFHAKSEIESAIAFWKDHIGIKQTDGKPVIVSFVWRRTGGQTFPLIHQQPQQWSCKAIFGSLGEFEIEAPGSKLAVQPILLGYRRSADRLLLRGEISISETELGLPGDVGNTAASAYETSTAAAQPAGFGPMTLLTIFSIVRDIVAILNPTCDLTLGGEVSATAFYDESSNAIQVDFQQMPGVKLVVLFEFDLRVKQLVISPERLHVEFGGSQWIKSRDFAVR